MIAIVIGGFAFTGVGSNGFPEVHILDATEQTERMFSAGIIDHA